MLRRTIPLAAIALFVLLIGVKYTRETTPAIAAVQSQTFTAGTTIFNIPTGITILDVEAQGSPGGSSFCGNPGGQPGRARARVTVVAGTTTMQVNVGGAASPPGGSNGGTNGGGNGVMSVTNENTSGGGGGASDVRIGAFGLNDRLVVGAGGGGGGGCGTGTGGAGGNGGNPATAGTAGANLNPGGGGGAATTTLGGTAGTGVNPGSAGVQGTGGAGGQSVGSPPHGNGGGGGGGSLGGGGGGASQGDNGSGGGGGGGGSNMVSGTSIANVTGTGASFVTIRWLDAPTLAKSFAPASILTGGTSTLTLVVSNPTSPEILTGINFTDILPSTPSQMTIAAGAQTNTCNGVVTAIVGGTSITLAGGGPLSTPATCTITVPVTTAGPGSFVNTTGVITANESGPGATSNPATLTVSNIMADLAVTKAASPNPVSVGGQITYTLGLSNAGPQPATTVVLSDTLPTGTTFVSASQTGGTPSFTLSAPAVGSGGTVTFSAATMTTTDTAQFQIIVLVGATAPATITNTATVSSGTADPNTGNNTATATVGLNVPAPTPIPTTIPAVPTVAPSPSPTPTATPIYIPNYYVTPVIPVFQNPAAGALFNPIAKTPTPRPVVAAAPPTSDPGGCNPPPGTGTAGICLRPPNTGDAGLRHRWLTSW